MAGETGSAREEAERLVATVLAIAQQGGARRDDDSIAATGARLVDGLGTLGNTLAGMVGHLAGAGGQPRVEQPADPQRPAQGPPAEETSGGRPGERQSGEWQPGERVRERQSSGGSGERQPGPRPVRYGWATGSAECCVCPICRTMANLRNPTPQSAARLATGAGDLATGVAGLMRAVSALSGTRPARRRPSRPAPPPPPPPPPDPNLAWSSATRSGPPTGPAARSVDQPGWAAEDPDRDGAPWSAATRAATREQQQRDAEARARKKRDAEAQAQQRRDAEARAQQKRDAEAQARKKRDAGARVQPQEDRSINPGASGPGAASDTGFGADVWAAATAERPAMDQNDAGGDARSAEA